MGYGFGLYHDPAIESVGVWFGFGQIQLTRWQVHLCLLKREDGYNRHWFTLGWDVD